MGGISGHTPIGFLLGLGADSSPGLGSLVFPFFIEVFAERNYSSEYCVSGLEAVMEPFLTGLRP